MNMENVLHSSNKILNQNTSKEMSWLKTVVPNVEMEEADDIVERFTCMSNVKRNNNVRQFLVCTKLGFNSSNLMYPLIIY